MNATEITAASSAYAIAREIERVERLMHSTETYFADLVEMYEVAKERERNPYSAVATLDEGVETARDIALGQW